MTRLTLFAVAVVALLGCNQKSERKKGGGGANTPMPTMQPQYPNSTPTNTLINGRNCKAGSDPRRVIISAQPGVHQQSQMQIVDPDGTNYLFTLQPAEKFLLMPTSDNYSVIPANGTYNGTPPNQNQNTGNPGILGGLFNGRNSNGAGHVTVAPSGNVYLRAVKVFDNSSGVVEQKSWTAKMVCL